MAIRDLTVQEANEVSAGVNPKLVGQGFVTILAGAGAIAATIIVGPVVGVAAVAGVAAIAVVGTVAVAVGGIAAAAGLGDLSGGGGGDNGGGGTPIKELARETRHDGD
jgi:hypothetical protein